MSEQKMGGICNTSHLSLYCLPIFFRKANRYP